MQGLTDGVQLAPHAEPLHEPPRGLVVGEALGHHATQVEFVEAEAKQLPDGLGFIAMAGVSGVENPAQLGLDSSGPHRNLGLCPGVLDLEHEVTDHLTVPFDDEGGGETVRLLERGAIVLQAVGYSGEPAANGLLTSEAPRRFGVVFACRAQGEPFGAGGPLQTVERRRR